MRFATTLLACLIAVVVHSQPQGADVFAQRHQVFGAYERNVDIAHYVFDLNVLVAFSNGNTITKDEFRAFFDKQAHDTTLAVRREKLNALIELRQKAFEGMSQGMDTTTAFRKEFLGYRNQLLLPYTSKGYSEAEAEAVSGMDFAMRSYYCGILAFEVMNKEVWSKVASDTSGQRLLYNSNPAKYNKPFSQAKPQVIYDYQKNLEDLLEARLDNAYGFRINEIMLKNM